MAQLSDRLMQAVRAKSPCVVGLDPRLDLLPEFVHSGCSGSSREKARAAITNFHEIVLDAIADLVPAVKPQLPFYEQHGPGSMEAFENTVRAAR